MGLPFEGRLKLTEHDPENLTDLQLIEKLLSLAIPNANVKMIAFRLLAQFGSYARAICAPPEILLTVEELGEDGIHALKLVRATMIKTLKAEIINRPVINNWDALIQYLGVLLFNEKKEKLLCLFLDLRNRLIADETIAEGTLNRVNFYPRELIQRALARHASALILVHNHPSGDPIPSKEDIVRTIRFQNVASELGIVIHDHIIIGASDYYSFAQRGLINLRPKREEDEQDIWN